jgi:hypothetical protein
MDRLFGIIRASIINENYLVACSFKPVENRAKAINQLGHTSFLVKERDRNRESCTDRFATHCLATHRFASAMKNRHSGSGPIPTSYR